MHVISTFGIVELGDSGENCSIRYFSIHYRLQDALTQMNTFLTAIVHGALRAVTV